MVLRFVDFELNDELCELRLGGVPVPVQPKAFRMLRHLAANADRVVTKGELLDTLWPGEEVSEASLTFCINAARRALGDSGADQRFIKAVRGHGYRFVVDVRRDEPSVAARTTAFAGAAPDRVLVGRGEELGVLDELAARLQAGQFSVVLLEGEAGIGKTALLREFARRAAEAGIRVLGAQGLELGTEMPFWVWGAAMRQYAASQEPTALREVLGEGAADLAKLLPALAHSLPDLKAAAALDPDQARLRLFTSVLGFLVRASRREPLLLCIDDLHWADRSSLLLLQYVLRELSGERVMILGTHRELATDPNETLASVVGDLRRHANARLLAVTGLPRGDVALLLREMLGPEAAEESVLDVVVARSQGNPFFVEQLCRHFADGAAQTTWQEAAAASLPPGIRELIGRRLQHFDSRALGVLSTAAVLGRRFSATVLGSVLGSAQAPATSDEEVFSTLDAALASHLVRDVASSPDRYEFSHALVQETLYAGVLGARRLKLHARVAETLERRGAEATDIAHHHLASTAEGPNAKAVEWASTAAEAAADRLAYEEAARWYERLLEIPGLVTDRARRVELLLAIGTMRGDSGQRAQSLQAFEAAAVLARELGAPVLLGRAALGIVYRRPLMRDFSFDALEEALATLPESEPGLRARLLARSAVWARQNPQSRSLVERRAGEALDLLARDGDPRIRGDVYIDLIAAIWYPDRAEQRRHLIDELRAISVQLGSAPLESWARFHLVWNLMEDGDMPAARRELADYTAFVQRLRQPGHIYNATVVSATFGFVDGDFARFDENHREALEVGRRIEEGDAALAMFAAQYFSSLVLRGGLGGIEPLMAAAESKWPVNPPQRWWGPLVSLEGGRDEEARERFEACSDADYEDFRFETMIGSLALATFVAEACVRLGDARRAEILFCRLEPYAQRWIVSSFGVVCCGPVSHHLATLASVQERWDEAEVLFELATRQLGETNAPAFLARTNASHAAMLGKRGRAGDAQRAETLLEQAEAAANELGLGAVAAQVGRIRAGAY